MSDSYHEFKLFLPYHAKRASAILRNEIPPPSLMEIDPTDEGCNQACPHCCFGSNPRRKIVQIDIEQLLRFVKDAYRHGTYAYELVGGGEPTAHAKIAEIITGIAEIAETGRERPHIGMVTNGVLLERIFPVAHHLDFIRVSLDAATAPLYESLHGVSPVVNHFDRVIRNIRNLINTHGSKLVRLGYLVVPPHNHQSEHIRQFIEFANQLGVGHVAFRPAYSDAVVDAAAWQEAAETILKEKARHRQGFIIGGEGGSWDHVLGVHQHPTGICRSRPLVLTVKANGTIPSCFLYRERLAERPGLGHISEGFEKLWFSESHAQSIRNFDRSSCPEVCKLYRAERALEIIGATEQNGEDFHTLDPKEVDDPYFI